MYLICGKIQKLISHDGGSLIPARLSRTIVARNSVAGPVPFARGSLLGIEDVEHIGFGSGGLSPIQSGRCYEYCIEVDGILYCTVVCEDELRPDW